MFSYGLILGCTITRNQPAIPQRRQQPTLSSIRISQSLESRKSLRRDYKKRCFRIKIRSFLANICWINIRNIPALQTILTIRLERLVCHNRSQIRTTDANIDYSLNRFASSALPLTSTNLFRKREHLLQNILHIRRDILPVNLQRI